jgi:hypothetical protein
VGAHRTGVAAMAVAPGAASAAALPTRHLDNEERNVMRDRRLH